jgi:YVTN family beta-propeller protein
MTPERLQKALALAIALATPILLAFAQDPSPQPAAQQQQRPKRTPPPGVSDAALKKEMTALKAAAEYSVPGTPDWQGVTEDAVWVSATRGNTVNKLDPKSGQVLATIEIQRPCAGMAIGFDSLWVPQCAARQGGDAKAAMSRIDLKTNKVVATVPAGPWQSEGGVAASPEGIWVITDNTSVLARIDPKTNAVAAQITIAPGSVNCVYADGMMWVDSPEKSVLTVVDTKTNEVIDTIAVGSRPRFMTAGAGSVWTLNQGDGTVSRVDTKSRKLIANIEAGIPGSGGELAYGEGHIWATIFEIPITQIDPATNKVVKQWTGPGGDSIRAAHGAVWLSNLRQNTVTRYAIKDM